VWGNLQGAKMEKTKFGPLVTSPPLICFQNSECAFPIQIC
jgi:hypothetical protein